ncbi:ATP-dependent helicase [Mesorhizobium sp. M0037]|uniref:ATP-dependent helicase n=1 Tax=unclassified Mesorhizobium TaxID=325217 RepID=UPI003335AC9A
MDSFETIRRLAAQLHENVARLGVDALNPLLLVEAAAKDLGLAIVFLEAGNTALKNGRALFDDQSGTICAENKGSAVDRALLVAHEIGHSIVHKKSSHCAERDIDPSQSTEAAPVGLQKVEDYGVRERRELEANVFARELVFPRDVAKRLHLEDGATAADICALTGLPVPLVRQQILDALLLPVIGPAAGKPATVFEEDTAQEVAAQHRGSPYLLRAGPGTGKTRTLVRRIETLVNDDVDLSSILVLTFSNRTAAELAERLSKAVGEKAASMWVGTFHGFGLDLIRRFHDKLGLTAEPTLFDRSDAISVLEAILPTLPLKHYRNLWDPVVVLREILQSISRAKDEVVSASEYRVLAQTMADNADPTDDKLQEVAAKCLEIASIYEIYEEVKRDRGCVDFGDLIMLPTKLMERDQSVRNAVRMRHRHALVDEYQDVNRASVRLVKAVAGEGRTLWAVGDARQSIYRFRGASSANMSAFAPDFPGSALGQLELSYRSTQRILDMFGKFSIDMPIAKELANLPLKAVRGLGPAKPQLRTLRDPDDEAAGIAASVRELEKEGVALRDQAVLCRTNDRLNEVAQALEDRGIPVLHLGSLFEREEIRDLLSILSLGADHFGAGLIRIGAMPRYAIPLQDVKRMISYLSDTSGVALTKLEELPSVSGLSNEAVEGIGRLARDLANVKSGAYPWDLLTTYLLDRTDLVRRMALASGIGDRMQSIAVWQFLNFLREHSPVATGSPIQTALDRVRNLVLLAEERDLRQVPDAALHMNAVRLMTIHGSKGLEFEAVHIPGFVKTQIPASYRASCPVPQGLIEGASGNVREEAERSHKQEQECLFFVAMSRARTHLHLYAHEKQRNGSARNPSDYLPRLKGTIDEIPAPASIRLPARPIRAVELAAGDEWERSHRHISEYEKCPRRFFYTHMLEIGTARRSTPFERTHACVYKFIAWLAEQRVESTPTIQAASAAMETIWNEKGPLISPYAADYRKLADSLVVGLLEAGAGRRFREAAPLAINYRNGSVVVRPDEIAERDDGVIVIRKVRTGKRSKSEFAKLEYSMYQKAANAHFGAGAQVEAVHPSDTGVEVVPRPKKTDTAEAKVEEILKGMGAGHFPPDPDPFRCPRCPHFFICAATPGGPLTLS